MNEIDHLQARQLINQAADAPLDAPQRAHLEAHLAGCPDCKAYARQVSELEQNLRALLHDRWDSTRVPMTHASQSVINRTRRQVMLRKFIGAAAVFTLFGVLLAAAIFAFNRLTPAASQEPILGEKVEDTPITYSPIQNLAANGLIAYVSYQEGNDDIFLMDHDGSEPRNLTNDSSRDYRPAWSPDGRKLAFVSDRTGAEEVYLTWLDGLSPVQLTHSPIEPYTLTCEGCQEQPEDAPRFPMLGELYWSPDGQYILTTVSTAPDRSLLGIIPTGGSAAVYLEASAFIDPQWSPDGSRIAFMDNLEDGKITLIGLETALASRYEPRLLAENLGFAAAVLRWSPDGLWLACFGKDTPGKTMLWLVNTQTGDARAVSEIGTFETTYTGLAAWSPDGRQVAFIIPGSPGDRVMAVSPDGGDPVLLLEASFPIDTLKWSPDGAYLLLASSAERLSRPDGRQLVDIASAAGLAVYSLDLARAPSAGALAQLTTSGLDYEPAWQPAFPAPVLDNLIAFSSQGTGDSTDIYVMSPDGSYRLKLTAGNCPTWSPDGRRLAFISEVNGVGQLFSIEPDGANLVQISRLAGDQGLMAGSLAWSPDGQWLAALHSSAGPRMKTDDEGGYSVALTGPVITLFKTDGSGQAVPLLEGYWAADMGWSPDGRLFTFVDEHNDGTVLLDIIPVDQQNPQPAVLDHILTAKFINAQGEVENDKLLPSAQTGNFAWSPDGSQLAYFNAAGELKVVDWIDEQAKNPHILLSIDPTFWAGSLKWSPDGSRLLFTSNFEGASKLYFTNTDGSDVTALADLLLDYNQAVSEWTFVWSPDWSPDGRQIVFTALGQEQSSIFVVDVNAALSGDPAASVAIAHETHLQSTGWQPARFDEVIAEETPVPTEEAALPTPLPLTGSIEEAEALAGFDMVRPGWLPEMSQELDHVEYTQDGAERRICAFYGSDPEELSICQAAGFTGTLAERYGFEPARDEVLLLLVNGEQAAYAQGCMDAEGWHTHDCRTQRLTWQRSGFEFDIIGFFPGDAAQQVLTQVAASLQYPPGFTDLVAGEGSCPVMPIEPAVDTGFIVSSGQFDWPIPGAGHDFSFPGVYIYASEGTPVQAAERSVVVFAGWVEDDLGWGQVVMLDHGNGYQTLYAHLSQVSVACGQVLQKGETLGLVGRTGSSAGPQLYFEMRLNGVPVNQLP